jgi:fatty acid desaturase
VTAAATNEASTWLAPRPRSPGGGTPGYSGRMDATFHSSLTPAELKPFLVREDGPSTRRLGVQIAGVAICMAGCAMPGLEWVATVALAVFFAALFAPFHECVHYTAFATRWKNTTAAWVTGLLNLQGPAVYKAFHVAHHQHTHDPARDPEIALYPEVIGRLPRGVFEHLGRFSGIGIALGKIAMLGAGALNLGYFWSGPLSFVHERDRRRVVWEGRLFVGWIALVCVAAVYVPAVRHIVAAWWASHVVLGVWLTAEHSGLPHAGTILQRTRSIEANALVRWITWNMNYHAEHHAWPGVPWFRIPALHDRIRGELVENPRGWGEVYLPGSAATSPEAPSTPGER